MLWTKPSVANSGASGPWGDGLADQSLSDLWYPARWDTVSDDEVAFLLPSLSQWRLEDSETASKLPAGPGDYLRRALIDRAVRTIAVLAQAPGASPDGDDALDLLASEGFITQIPTGALSSHRSSRKVNGAGPASATLIADGLHALAYLDRMVFDAAGARAAAGRSPILSRPSSLTDATIATVHARLNAAYVYPEFAFGHELLTIAAIIGHLVEGRPAYVSPLVAETMADIMGRPRRSDDRGNAALVLQNFAKRIGGASYLARLAARGCRRTVMIRPHKQMPEAARGAGVSGPEIVRRVRREL